MNDTKLYYVLPSDMAKQLDYTALEEISYDYVRKSIDGTMAIVEYKGALSVRGGSYLTHAEAIELMHTDDWHRNVDVVV